MKDRLKFVWTIVVIAIANVTNAQNSKPLSLSEAIELSIKNSKQLKADSAKIQQAAAAVKEAFDKRLPDAGASAAYMRLSNANVNIKMKTGNSGSGGSGAPGVNQAMYAIVNGSLPLYAGGRIRYGIESSKFLEQATILDAENNKEELIQNTIAAYMNLYKAGAAVTLFNQNLAEAQQRVKDFTNLEQNGLLARNDLLKAQLQASNTELALLDAQNNWQLANVNMNLMLGLPEKTVLLPDSTIINQQFPAKNIEDYEQDALKNRKDVQALSLRKDAAGAGVKAARGEYYPSIALTGGYIAANIPKVLSITNAVNIGVGVQYNIASLWKTKAKIEAAQGRARELEANQELANDNIRLQVSKAYLTWLSSQKKIDVYVKAIEQADENYRIVKNKYTNSLATLTDLLDADIAQLQAHLNYTFAKADAVTAYNQLLLTAGDLSQSN